MRVVSGLVPPGGWHYRQKLVSSPARPRNQVIGAVTYEQLVENVFQFRLNNLEMVPSGTATREQAEQDITFYLCGHWPHNCTGSKAELANAGRTPPTVKHYSRPINRIEDWLTVLSERPLKWVDQARASERARICLKCPLNQTWRTGCGPCNENAARRATLFLGSRSTGLESKLKGCVSFGTLLNLSVWLENDFTAPGRKPPDECWKLTEAKK
jgi:hypothetical protein